MQNPKKKLKMEHVNPVTEALEQAENIPSEVDKSLQKRLLLNLKSSLKKNQQFRMKYDDPMKFIETEVDLVEAINNITVISSAPELYQEFIALKGHLVILELLNHENTDIVIAALNLINEITDEDGLESVHALQGSKSMVKALVDNALLPNIAAVISNLNENNEDDQQGLFNIMSILENITQIKPELCENIIEQKQILGYFSSKLKQNDFDSNVGYVSELMAVLLQTSERNRKAVVEDGFLDMFLQVLARYRKQDPKGGDEIENFENIFDCVCCIVQTPELKSEFINAEGIELMVIFMKSKKMARMRAIKTLDHLFTGPNSLQSTGRFVELGGLKVLFPFFMAQNTKDPKEYLESNQKEQIEHLVSIIASLFRTLRKTEYEVRILNKFIENSNEKLHRLLMFRLPYASNPSLIKPSTDDDEYIDRLDAGLYTLQMIDTILVYLMSMDAALFKAIPTLLNLSGENISNVFNIVQEYIGNIDANPEEKQVLHNILKDLTIKTKPV